MFDLTTLIQTIGYFGIFAIAFAESGVFLGFFLPGDTLLFTAGLLAQKGMLNYWILVLGSSVAAVLGDSFGYAFGRKLGPAIFKKEDSFLFHRDHLEKARKFYEKHGGKTIILARFMPIVRTFAPILAGVGKMHYPKFVIYNVIGGALWVLTLTALGFYLGSVIPNIEYYILPIIILIVIVSVSPTLVPVLKNKNYRNQVANQIRNFFSHSKKP